MTARETQKAGRGGAPRARKRRHFLVMGLGVASVGASIALAAVLALKFGMTSSHVVEAAATPAQGGTAASILIHPEGSKCQNRLFDNQTGQISQTSAPCPVTQVDAKGVPVPLGTVRTMNSISQSFK